MINILRTIYNHDKIKSKVKDNGIFVFGILCQVIALAMVLLPRIS